MPSAWTRDCSQVRPIFRVESEGLLLSVGPVISALLLCWHSAVLFSRHYLLSDIQVVSAVAKGVGIFMSLCVCAHTVWLCRVLIAGSECAPRGDAVNTAPALQGLRWTGDSSYSKGEPGVLTGIYLSTTRSSFSFKIPSVKADKGKQTDPAELAMG